MMLLVMGGKTANKIRLLLAAANVVIAGNLSHEDADVQFSNVQNVNFYLSGDPGPPPRE